MKDLLRYLQILRERRYLFVSTAILLSLLFVGGSYLLPKKYQAESTVFVEKSVITNLVKGIAVTPDMDDRIRVLRYALLSRGLIGRVLDRLDIDPRYEDERARQQLISDLRARTRIKVKGKELFIVSITDPNPVFARDFINKLVNTYVEENLSGKREETYGANRFLDEQIAHFKQKLDEAEDAIIAFRKEQGVFLSEGEGTNLADLKDYRKQLEQVGIKLNTLQAKRAELKQRLAQIPATVAIFSEKHKNQRLSYLEARLRELLTTYTENYPEVVQIRAEMETIRRQGGAEDTTDAAGSRGAELMVSNPTYHEVEQKIFDLEAEIGALKSQRASLEQLVRTREEALQNVPINRKKLAVLVQERDSYRRIYEELLLRVGQAEVSKQMEIGDKATTFRIVDPAYLPVAPIFPDRIKMILLAIAAGIGCAAGLVLVLENTRPRIRTIEEAQVEGVPILGVIPTIVESPALARLRRYDLLLAAAALVYAGSMAALLAFEWMKKIR